MSNAGYGNHDAPPPGGAEKAKNDRANVDGGSSPDKNTAGGTGKSTADNDKTPGTGALPSEGQGGEVDPAAG